MWLLCAVYIGEIVHTYIGEIVNTLVRLYVHWRDGDIMWLHCTVRWSSALHMLGCGVATYLGMRKGGGKSCKKLY